MAPNVPDRHDIGRELKARSYTTPRDSGRFTCRDKHAAANFMSVMAPLLNGWDGHPEGEALLGPDDLLRGLGQVDERILRQLREAQASVGHHCLDCGYSGAMPVVDTREPWFRRWWGILALSLSGFGLIVLAIIFASTGPVITARCPNCRRVQAPVN